MSDMTLSGATAPMQKSMPSWLPEKFWDQEAGDVRVEALARSYIELERRLGAPGDPMASALRSLPESADGYELNVDDLLDVDADVNQRLFDAGFSNEQAQLVYDLAAERLLPMVQQISGEVDDARQLDRVMEHFGGPERFDAIRPQLRAWGEANLKPEIFKSLAGSAEGVIAIHTMMQNREPGLSGSGSNIRGVGEADLKRMMTDPRYWRERDPTFVAQVREGFRQLYPEA